MYIGVYKCYCVNFLIFTRPIVADSTQNANQLQLNLQCTIENPSNLNMKSGRS